MTILHTYFYIVVDTQRGCHTLKKTLMGLETQERRLTETFLLVFL